MRSNALTGLVVVAGALAGSLLMLAAPEPLPKPIPVATTSPPVTFSTTAPAPQPPSSPPHPDSLSDQVLLVWTPGGLPPRLAESVASLPEVAAVTVVRADLIHLVETQRTSGEVVDAPEDGYVIPVEVIGYDPAGYPRFLPKPEGDLLAGLEPGEVVLGSSSARLRRLDTGGTLVLEDGTSLVVAGVVDDVLIGAAEAALPAEAAAGVGVSVERYLLIRYSGERTDLEAAVKGLLPAGVAVRIRGPGETPVLRHGDAVLPQVTIKEVFGEFAYRPGPGRSFDVDPAWITDSLVTTRVPLLGTVTCNRNLLPSLAGAMEELAEANLGFLVDPDRYRGCFNPRYIGGGKGISRHAWGAALDINTGANPEGVESAQDPRLIEVMERWGFTSGDEWLVPDPGHFEYLRPPD